MNLRRIDLSQLIPTVNAQVADALAQPTFGVLNIGGGSVTQSAVNLTSNSTAVAVGETFSVDIEISTGNFTINEYRLVISYDTTKLSVIDSDPGTTGTQITPLDTVFSVGSGDNFVTPGGRINLIAKTPSGNALRVNRKVARITFQAQTTGDIRIEPLSGVDGTQLINENGIAIASTLNSLTLNASSQATTSSPTSTSTTSTVASSESSTTTSPANAGGQLPNTAIGDDLLAIAPFLIGSILIALGVSLRRELKKQK